MRVGEQREADVELAGGMRVLINSLVEDGPAVSITIAQVDRSVPLYLRPGGHSRRMEITLGSGIRFWVMSPGTYQGSLRTRTDSRGVAILGQMEDGRPPVWLVFTDAGNPAVTILTGYLSTNGGRTWYAYESGGFRLRPNAPSAEAALLQLAQVREAEFR